MQAYQQTPIFSDVADWFAYPALTTSQNNTIEIDSASGSNKGYITFQAQHYFVFHGFACVTNYDNFSGAIATADAAPVNATPSVPNAFTVEIQRATMNDYANLALTQAEVCSSGLLSGKQVPLPVIYGPSVTVSFNFTDLTNLYQLDADGEPVPLKIQFWMLGYSIEQGPNNENWLRFLQYFPHLQNAYAI